MESQVLSQKILYRTKNYDMFGFFDCNRAIVESHVNKFVKELSTCNLLHKYPITVDGTLHIIDGQHRFLACKRLGIDVVYQIDANFKLSDMQKINSCSKDWSLGDNIHFFARLGNEYYQEVIRMQQQYECPISDIIVCLGFMGKNYSDNIKDGKLKFNIAEKREIVDERMKFKKRLTDLIRIKGMGQKRYLTQWTFIRGLYRFLGINGVDQDVFLQKMEKSIGKMSGRACAEDYVKLFLEIYNYGNRNRIKELS